MFDAKNWFYQFNQILIGLTIILTTVLGNYIMYSVEVPTIKGFNELVARVDRVEAENEFIKSLLLGERWLSRVQAMKAIGCSEKTLKRLADAKRLTVRYEGAKPFYDVFSIRDYLTAQSIDSVLIDKRILTAKYGE